MKENRFGNRFQITTFGESHSKAMGVLIEGIKPNIKIDIKDIQNLLDQRKPGRKKYHSQRKEDDKIEILSGIFNNLTLGTPIVAIVYNKDHRSKDYSEIKDIFRPSHADFTFFKKYGIRDYRGGGRASARETLSRVIPGAIAIKLLKEKNIIIESKIIQIGPLTRGCNPLNNDSFEKEIIKLIETLDGDSIGGVVETKIYGAQVGLGDPIFEKLDANIAKAIISIPAAKGVEFGEGFRFATQKGSIVNDQMDKNGFISNYSGGIQGGISNGETIIFRTVFKPTPSISKKQITQNIYNEEREIFIKGRHDPALILRTIPIINSMTALVLQDAVEENEILQNSNKNNITNSLDKLREEIKLLDISLFNILDKRLKIVQKVSQEKKKLKIKIENLSVEKKLVKNIIDMKFENLDNQFIKNIYQIIFTKSKKSQK